ncbi:MAG: hypothetical protein CVV44_05020 [Spirochaetae bacterium HGW-Spirochaetae-1]|nr:MAG: hypothetical protein CVV44_05020 [Spirochaetae bacterium HGW-Spirochaetae-1]
MPWTGMRMEKNRLYIKETVMAKMGFFEKIFMPDYKNLKQISWGTITIDENKCTGCGICAEACPADSIYIADKKAHMRPRDGVLGKDPGLGQCIACGDCRAICHKGAIELTGTYSWSRFFKTIDRGDMHPPRL